MKPMEVRRTKKVLRFSNAPGGAVEGRVGLRSEAGVVLLLRPIRRSDIYRIMLIVSWVTVLNVVTDFALAS